MSLIAVTQRVVTSPHGERRDALDQRMGEWLAAQGATLLALSNHTPMVQQQLATNKPTALILSGGNNLTVCTGAGDTAPERDATERALLDWAVANRIPVLGICRGAQMVNHYFGGTLQAVTGHAGTTHAVHFTDGSADRMVHSYHDWGIAPGGLAAALNILAAAPDSTVEAFTHTSLPITGIMWHPERESLDPADARWAKGLLP